MAKGPEVRDRGLPAIFTTPLQPDPTEALCPNPLSAGKGGSEMRHILEVSLICVIGLNVVTIGVTRIMGVLVYSI